MKKYSGFTLIEVAIVMVIIGLALAASIGPLTSQIERSKIAETNAILDDVEEALYGFASARGYLPCPASAVSGGEEVINGGDRTAVPNGVCTFNSNGVATGFLPGTTLNLSGKYNADRLLLDAWDNPIRYSVTQSNHATQGNFAIPDFTGLNTAAQSEMRNVGIANLAPDINICTQATTSPTGLDCLPINTRLAQNAVAVILSLGNGGHLPITGGDQIENSGEDTMTAAIAPGGTGRTYQIADDRAFVARGYKDTTTTTGLYNDQIRWISPNTLYSKMITAGALP